MPDSIQLKVFPEFVCPRNGFRFDLGDLFVRLRGSISSDSKSMIDPFQHEAQLVGPLLNVLMKARRSEWAPLVASMKQQKERQIIPKALSVRIGQIPHSLKQLGERFRIRLGKVSKSIEHGLSIKQSCHVRKSVHQKHPDARSSGACPESAHVKYLLKQGLIWVRSVGAPTPAGHFSAFHHRMAASAMEVAHA